MDVLPKRRRWRRLVQWIRQMVRRVVAWLYTFHDGSHRTVQHVEVGLRSEADPECPGNERSEDYDFAEREVFQSCVFFADLAEHGALEQPQQVGGAERDPDRGPHGPIQAHLIRAAEN